MGERTGWRAVRRRDVIAMRPVPEDVAGVLGVDADTMALTMTNHYWDQNSDSEFARDYLGPDRELCAEYVM